MAAPSIPPRPSRSSNMPMPTAATLDVPPQVPARPRRGVERSVSPAGDRYARSPLNDPAYSHKTSGRPLGSSLSHEVPQRPPSVSLPSVGQEGLEYEVATPQPEESNSNPLDPQKTSTAGEIPLHAPKASLPVSTAKQRIAAVTRTDSSQAAAMGIGKTLSNASETDLSQPITRSHSRHSQSRTSRPASLYKLDSNLEPEEQGIPMIGVQVPMYPNAGDVQAPTPSPGLPPPSKGVGFFNNVGHNSRSHSRSKSREVFHGPPGSYGLHGHGVNHTDPFEKAWYEKHPEALAREARGEYGPAISDDRREWALTSEELNKLVHGKNQNLPGMGTSPTAIGTPIEDIGYLASEEYTQRISRPSSTKPRRPSSQTYTESPLRKMSFPAEQQDAARRAGKQSAAVDHAVESEAEDEVIHVDMSRLPRRFENNKPTVELGPEGGKTASKGGDNLDYGEAIPILASDESAFRPESRYMQPAIEPEIERRSGAYLDTPGSRPHSRSNSFNLVSQNHLAQLQSRDVRPDSIGTPLDDVKEYEPLFSDEDEPRADTAPAALGTSEKAKPKRPDLARHHFPSRDVWEDVPDSLAYVTTVDTPEPQEQIHREAEHEPKDFFETPEAEARRKETITADDKQSFLPKETADFGKKKFKSDVLGDAFTRPGMAQRFPSSDIWEDTPSSSMYTTTVDPDEESEDVPSPAAAKQPVIPSRPSRKSASEATSAEARQTPSVPGRPKPQIPARPSKLRQSSDASETAPLSESISRELDESGGAASAGKVKPAIPTRPAGSKIAALQAGFMSDLNKKLGLGPQVLKKDEPEEAPVEKAPLVDARKGRARGPQRRKPGAASASTDEEGDGAQISMPSRPVFSFTISRPQTIWEVDEGVLSVPVTNVAEDFKSLKIDEAKSLDTAAGNQLKTRHSEDLKTAPDHVSSVECARTVSQPVDSDVPADIQLMAEYTDNKNLPKDAISSRESIRKLPETAALSESRHSDKENHSKGSQTTETAAVQTGETTLKMTGPDGTITEATAYLGGRAQAEGSVVVTQDGEEHVGGVEKANNS